LQQKVWTFAFEKPSKFRIGKSFSSDCKTPLWTAFKHMDIKKVNSEIKLIVNSTEENLNHNINTRRDMACFVLLSMSKNLLLD